MFLETNSNFYDIEYFFSMEYRYLSGAHGSRVRNILKIIGDVKGKKILDVGGGGGFLANELEKRGAKVVVIDYSEAAIQFTHERYPKLLVKVESVCDLSAFRDYDMVLLLDVIEHVSNHQKMMEEIKKTLKIGGQIIISTDVEHSPINKRWYYALERLSKEGRAYRLIKQVEAPRKKSKNYHDSHIHCLSIEEIKQLLSEFKIENHAIYPLVGVPPRDFFLSFLPQKYHGDHQCIKAVYKPAHFIK